MAIATYSDLCTAVANWLGGRSDLTSRIPEFIALAEAKFNRSLKCPQMETRSYTTVNTSSTEPEFVSLPGDFQTMRRIRLSGVTGKPQLSFVSQTQGDQIRYSRHNTTGRPAYFTVFGNEIELIPTPDSAYELEMVYRANIPALASNSTNWLLTLAPDAYLYGALLESAPYIKDDERVALWAAALTNTIDAINSLGLAQSFNAGPVSMRPDGYTP